MVNIPEIYGSLVFNDREMKGRLSAQTYKALKATLSSGKALDAKLADEIGEAMKIWAIAKGATHYTHWFQPMTGLTAEKHDAFMMPSADGTVIMEFKGKELIKGESDASSFPSGGMRATCEARGYTAWDPTSPAFVLGTTMYIPTCFVSYTGEVLDKKTPLLRSMEAIDRLSTKLVNMFGIKCNNTHVTVGAEQEYFLIDRDMYAQRKDLKYTGRTLFGAQPPKGQELEDQYFGTIKTRVLAYMEELDEQLWKLGIASKTRHNEVAPAQHELAPVYESLNVAADHNLLTMEVMKKLAEKHGFVCLLHEKPFKGVNGSGKHNNWSLTTDSGLNLFAPGKNPSENLLFLTFISAVIKAVDDHQDLLRLSVSTAGNDHRLGANEAPPAIMSIYLGDDLTSIFESIENGTTYTNNGKTKSAIKVAVIPDFEMDTADRNRTSPFAFTGNKFEFRALGSSINIAGPNIMLNTAVADALGSFIEELESAADFKQAVWKLITQNYKKHKRIVFNGDNYSDKWIYGESKKRGLLEIKSTPDALTYYTKPENIKMFERLGVFTGRECYARKEILLEQYAKVINIEAHTMYKIISREMLPACVEFMNTLSKGINSKKLLNMAFDYEGGVLYKISSAVNSAYIQNNKLEDLRKKATGIADIEQQNKFLHDVVLANMQGLRDLIDELELLVGRDYWPMPSYGDLLFYI